jgi:hypothetical protein
MNFKKVTRQFRNSLPNLDEFVEKTMPEYLCSRDEAVMQFYVYLHEDFDVFENEQYQVQRFPRDDVGMVQLSIHNNDGSATHDWRDMQDIKNTIMGPDYEAVELYPSEFRKRDIGNVYHLFVHSVEGKRFPFGAQGRRVSNDAPEKYSQRPLPDYDVESKSQSLT